MQTCEVQAMQTAVNLQMQTNLNQLIVEVKTSLGSTAEEMDYDGPDSLTEQIENFRRRRRPSSESEGGRP